MTETNQDNPIKKYIENGTIKTTHKNCQSPKPFQRKPDTRPRDRKKNQNTRDRVFSYFSPHHDPTSTLLSPEAKKEVLDAKSKQMNIKTLLTKRDQSYCHTEHQIIDSTVSLKKFQQQNYGRGSTQRIIPNVDSPYKQQIEILRQLNNQNCLKIKTLTQKNTELRKQNTNLKTNISEFESRIQEQQEDLSQLTLKLSRAEEQVKQQKQINKCLQIIIEGLNAKVERMIGDQINKKNNDQTNQFSMDKDLYQELNRELDKFKEMVVSLNEKIKYYEVEVGMMKRMRHELTKQKALRESFENRNRSLQQQLETMRSIKRIKGLKTTKNKRSHGLETSLSFSLQ